jgi:hypothetical protein
MESEQERLDELFFRDSQWVADNGRYIHENNGADSFIITHG